MGKKLLSLLLALVMVVMVLPMTALAADDAYVGQPTTASVDVTVGGGAWECVVSYDSGVQELKLNGTSYKSESVIDSLFSFTGTKGSYNFDVVFNTAGSHTITVTAHKTLGVTSADDVVKSVTVNVLACNHEPGEVVDEGQKATCLVDGVVKQFECKYCGALVDEKGEVVTNTVISAQGHVFGEKVLTEQAGTCRTDATDDCWQCENCNLYFASDADKTSSQGFDTMDSFKHGKNPTNHAGVRTEAPGNPPTCTDPGNDPYWVCSGPDGCGWCFAKDDLEGKYPKYSNEFNLDAVSDAHVKGDHVDAKAATCIAGGNVEYWLCSKCSAHLDANGKVIENEEWKTSINPTGHTDRVEVPAQAPNCKEPGNEAYWCCKGSTGCGMCFAMNDLEGKYPKYSNEFTLNPVAEAHVKGKKVDAQAATCNAYGRVEHYECAVEGCNAKLAEDGTVIEKVYTPKDPANHNPEKRIDFHPNHATCNANGMDDYWQCGDCKAFFAWDDEKGENPKAEGDFWHSSDPKNHAEGKCIFYPAKDATCGGNNAGGYDAHWYCSACKKYYFADDTEFEHPMDDNSQIWHSVDGANHVEGACILYPAKAATCNDGGYDEYWHCDVCGMWYFGDDVKFEHPMEDNSKIWISSDPANHAEGKCILYPAKENNCVEDGYDSHWYCDACKKWYAADDVNFENPMDTNAELWHPAMGHDYVLCEDIEGMPYEVCTRCGLFKVNGEEIEAIPALHNLEFHKGTPATCTEDGEIDYWYCIDEDCGAKFADLKATKPLSDEDLVIPAGHNIIKLDIKFSNGYPYYYCTKCGSYFEDEYGKAPAKAPDAKHVLVGHEATAPNCQHGDGNSKYYECVLCGEFYSDAEGQKQIAVNSWGVPYRATNAAYHNLTLFEKTNDHIEYYRCDNCGMCFDGKDETAKVLDPSDLGITSNVGDHALKFMTEVPATCTTAGTKAHWVCLASHNCGKYFTDSLGKSPVAKTDLVIPAGHKYIHFKGNDATMDSQGRKGYDYCTVCGLVRLDGSESWITMDEAMQNWGIEVLPDTAEAVMHPKVPATCIKTGMKKHWSVESLRDHTVLYYLDQALTKPVSEADLVIPMVDHVLYPVAETATSNAYYKCINCGQCFETNDSTKPNIPGGNEDDFIKPTEPPAPTETTPDNVIKDDMDLSGMHMSSILGKGNEP